MIGVMIWIELLLLLLLMTRRRCGFGLNCYSSCCRHCCWRKTRYAPLCKTKFISYSDDPLSKGLNPKKLVGFHPYNL